jgi:hypothetical protein
VGYVCPECGLDYDSVAAGDIPVALRSYPRRYRETLAFDGGEDDTVLRTRPEPSVWSALEYTAHVADTYGDFIELFRAWLATGTPGGEGWDPDQRALEQRYNERDPEQVLAELDANATALADVLDDVEPEDWRRTGTFPWGERDVLTMARNGVHEGIHHLRDIENVLARVRAAGTP